MSTGGTVEELHAEVNALLGALALHTRVACHAEQEAVAHPEDPAWSSVAALHREIADEYKTEIRLLNAEIALLPQQRPPNGRLVTCEVTRRHHGRLWRCDREAGHGGVHWSDAGGIIWC